MTDSLLPALIVFGILFAIALFGLIRSSAAAERLNGSRHNSDDMNGRRNDPSWSSGTGRP